MAEEQGGMVIEGSPPPKGDDRASIRAAVLADWGKEVAPVAAAEPEPAAPEPDVEAPAEPAPEPTAEPEAPAPEPNTDDEATEPDAEVPTPPEAPPDRELAKRLEAVSRAEKRAKDGVARERDGIARERSEVQELRKQLAAELAEVKQFKELQGRARFDPVGVMSALGLPEEDYEPAARQFYSRSAAARQDPKLREQADRAMREREQSSTVSHLAKQVEDLHRQIAERETRVQHERLIETYLAGASKAVSDDTPIVRNMLSKSPEKTRERIGELAERLFVDTGEVPDVADVVRELEKSRRAELEEAGIDVAQIFNTSKNRTPAAGEKRNGKSLSNELSTPTKPRTEPKTREELRAETLQALHSGELE